MNTGLAKEAGYIEWLADHGESSDPNKGKSVTAPIQGQEYAVDSFRFTPGMAAGGYDTFAARDARNQEYWAKEQMKGMGSPSEASLKAGRRFKVVTGPDGQPKIEVTYSDADRKTLNDEYRRVTGEYVNESPYWTGSKTVAGVAGSLAVPFVAPRALKAAGKGAAWAAAKTGVTAAAKHRIPRLAIKLGLKNALRIGLGTAALAIPFAGPVINAAMWGATAYDLGSTANQLWLSDKLRGKLKREGEDKLARHGIGYLKGSSSSSIKQLADAGFSQQEIDSIASGNVSEELEKKVRYAGVGQAAATLAQGTGMDTRALELMHAGNYNRRNNRINWGNKETSDAVESYVASEISALGGPPKRGASLSEFQQWFDRARTRVRQLANNPETRNAAVALSSWVEEAESTLPYMSEERGLALDKMQYDADNDMYTSNVRGLATDADLGYNFGVDRSKAGSQFTQNSNSYIQLADGSVDTAWAKRSIGVDDKGNVVYDNPYQLSNTGGFIRVLRHVQNNPDAKAAAPSTEATNKQWQDYYNSKEPMDGYMPKMASALPVWYNRFLTAANSRVLK